MVSSSSGVQNPPNDPSYRSAYKFNALEARGRKERKEKKEGKEGKRRKVRRARIRANGVRSAGDLDEQGQTVPPVHMIVHDRPFSKSFTSSVCMHPR